ncbi:MAG: hypothetical protein C3F02_00965 [Parcubacteria group bacterium]|nr:MAG: hypothetical protein C3F02_00965 [Parcubacteria group bacterium]
MMLFLLLALFLLTGCLGLPNSVVGGNTKTAILGGMFRSSDRGETWQRVTTLYTIGDKTLNFNAANITTMAFDPKDQKAIYVGTQTNGLFYTFNYGDGWFNTLTDKGTVNSIVVNPESNCVIYVAVHNSIYKSVDCSRKWEQVYFETRSGQYITSLSIDYNNTNVIYAGTSGGSFLKSKDAGHSWDVLKRFDYYINNIIIQNHLDSRIIYVATQNRGIFKTLDGGQNWVNLLDLPVDQSKIDEEKVFNAAVEKKKKELGVTKLPQAEMDKLEKDKYILLKSVAGAYSVVSVSADLSVKDGLVYANPNGIFRLTDGMMWKQLSLLTPPGKDNIYSVIVNPKDTNEVLYGTSNAWYRSVDNGANWTIRSLPTDHTARIMAFSPDQKYLYLGAYKINK